MSESVQFQTTEPAGTAAIQQPQEKRTKYVRCITGDGDMFHPDDPITRGQMAQILCAILDDGEYVPSGEASFTDVPADSPVYASVERLASLGIVGGYGDGTYRPDETVSRSEAVSVLCRMEGVSEVTALSFPDVPAEHWALGSVAAAMSSGWLTGFEDGGFYPDAPLTRAEAAVLINRAMGRTPNKAAIDIVYTASPYVDVPKEFWAYYDIVDISVSNELMDYIMGEAENAARGMILLDGRLCHINAELKLDGFQKGFHTIQDGLATDGLYYAPEDGYFLQRSQPGLQELDGSMFYVLTADGPFVTNYDLGYLHFGENGRYTSGDVNVDGYVDSIMADIIQGNTASLLNEDKLRQAYDYLLYSDYDYMTRPVGWQRGSTSWSLGCAKTMYQTKRGSCYYWAAAFLYLARRLGFQAYPVCGGVNQYNALHAWVMIDHGSELDDNDVNTEKNKNLSTREIDPDEYIYDIELDWAYRTGAHGRTPIRPGRNLFKQPRGQSVVHYIFPGDTWTAPPMDDTDAIGAEENGAEDGELFEDGDGNDLVEGVDYTTSYVNNGDGTITVTITYLTGDQAGTVTSYTVLDPNYDPNASTATPEPTAEPSEPTAEPSEPTAEPSEPTAEPSEPTAEPSEPTAEPSEPTAEPSEPTTEPSEPTTEPGEPTTEPGEPTAEPDAGDGDVEEQPGGDVVVDDGVPADADTALADTPAEEIAPAEAQ